MLPFKKIFFAAILMAAWFYLLQPYFRSSYAYHKSSIKPGNENTGLFTPKSGRGVLPLEAQLVVFSIDTFKFKDFNLYKSFGDFHQSEGNKAEIYQRIIESAWPIKLDTNSRNLIGFKDDISNVPGINIVLLHNHIAVGTY